jgi:hypothetical protein
MVKPGASCYAWQCFSCHGITASDSERKRSRPLQTEGTRHSDRTSISCIPLREGHHPSRRSSHLISITPYTRYWFDHNVKTTSCATTEPPASAETAAAPHPPTDCPQEALTRLQTEKRLAPYLRTTRANPTGHFWFTKIPAGRYYIVSLIDEGAGPRQEGRLVGLAWLTIELDACEKLKNLVVTDCKTSFC